MHNQLFCLAHEQIHAQSLLRACCSCIRSIVPAVAACIATLLQQGAQLKRNRQSAGIDGTVARPNGHSAPLPQRRQHDKLLYLHADLQICEPDKPTKIDGPSARPNDPLYPQQWALSAINVSGAWGAGALGSQVFQSISLVCLSLAALQRCTCTAFAGFLEGRRACEAWRRA